MVLGRKAASTLLAVCATWLAGCGEGLGECDTTMLGGNPTPGMEVPYDGQMVIATSCASGRCHSESATGDQRFGAPAGLNFDVLAATTSEADSAKLVRSIATVVDWSEDIWDEIEGDTMPPEKPAGGGPLSATDKEKVRNWLACGAPRIGANPSGGTATWESIWSGISAAGCLGCHNAAGAGASGGAILGEAGDACGSYDLVVGKTGVASGMCAGMPLVTPFQPQSSHLLLKIKADPTRCGGPMPYNTPEGLTQSNPQLIQQLETWIMSGAEPPVCP